MDVQGVFSGMFLFIFGAPGLFMVVLGFVLWLGDRRGGDTDRLNPPAGKRLMRTGALLIAAAGAAVLFEVAVS